MLFFLYTVLTLRFWCGSVCLCWWHHPIFINYSLWGASGGVGIIITVYVGKATVNRCVSWSAICVVELWVGKCRWHHQHKHTLAHWNLKVKTHSMLTIHLIIFFCHIVWMKSPELIFWFCHRLYTNLSMVTDDPQSAYPDTYKAWQKFQPCLTPVADLVYSTEKVFQSYVSQSLLEFYQDNVQYMEIRFLPIEVKGFLFLVVHFWLGYFNWSFPQLRP